MKYPRELHIPLPLTFNPRALYDFYRDLTHHYTEEEYRDAVHDLALYRVPANLDFDGFIAALSEAFLTHPVITGLIGEIEREGYLYYGRVRGWIKHHCGPSLHRKQLIQITLTVLKWFEVLGAHRFRIDRPNLGQRISAVSVQ